jgi:hypothetical protein
MSIASSPFILLPLDLIVGQPEAITKGNNMSSFSSGSSSTDSKQSMQSPSSPRVNSALRETLIGFVPLVLLVVIVAITLAVTDLVRQFFASSGFFSQQQAEVITLIVGLVIALVVFIVAIVLTLRREARWQPQGAARPSRAALWSLAITALIVLVPVLLALLLPQNPAP